MRLPQKWKGRRHPPPPFYLVNSADGLPHGRPGNLRYQSRFGNPSNSFSKPLPLLISQQSKRHSNVALALRAIPIPRDGHDVRLLQELRAEFSARHIGTGYPGPDVERSFRLFDLPADRVETIA